MKITVGSENDVYDGLICSKCGELLDDAYYERGDVVLCEECYNDVLAKMTDDISNDKLADANTVRCVGCGKPAEYKYDGNYYCVRCLFDEIDTEARQEAENYFDDYVDDYV